MKCYYEAILYSLNSAKAKFEFEADSTELGRDNAQALINSGTKGFEWNKKPDYNNYIEFRKKGLTRWKKCFATRIPIEY